MNSKFFRQIMRVACVLGVAGSFAMVASANHSWGGYHWARTANPFTLRLDDNVSAGWDVYLAQISNNWSLSSVLDTVIAAGTADPRRCKPVAGRVEVCDSKYGNNNWLGIASIWVNGTHITQGTVKLNDTYFNTARYNTPAWKQFVACQEVGHTFGLDHQDINFNNSNLGTCMDYTNDPDGALYGQLSNTQPNQHDYDELATIYSHLDAVTTLGQLTPFQGRAEIDHEDSRTWGKEVRRSSDGRGSLYGRDFGNGQKVFTFVIWARE